jgi:UDP-N-acetylglucosamine 2-epimerase (non-hydrolysing)
VTERTEGVTAGTAILVGSSKVKIIDVTSKLLIDADYYEAISKASNPYGDGTTSNKIKTIILQN